MVEPADDGADYHECSSTSGSASGVKSVASATLEWAITSAYSGTKYEDKTEEVLKDLDKFIKKHKVTEQNIELLVAWVQRQRDVYVTFYRDIDPILGPYMAPNSPGTDSWEDDDALYGRGRRKFG